MFQKFKRMSRFNLKNGVLFVLFYSYRMEYETMLFEESYMYNYSNNTRSREKHDSRILS